MFRYFVKIPYKVLSSFLVLLIVFSAIPACALHTDQMLQFTRSYRSYERAIRWQEYDRLRSFHKNNKEILTEEERKRLKKFRVSAYNVLVLNVAPDIKSALQIVEVKYYNHEYNVVRDMTLTNKWEFDEEKNRWELANPFPEFR